MRQLEEDVDSDTEVEPKENKVNVSWEPCCRRSYGCYNITIFDQQYNSNESKSSNESSDESEDDYRVNENNLLVKKKPELVLVTSKKIGHIKHIKGK